MNVCGDQKNFTDEIQTNSNDSYQIYKDKNFESDKFVIRTIAVCINWIIRVTYKPWNKTAGLHCCNIVACVWPACCNVPRRVGCGWLKFEYGQI